MKRTLRIGLIALVVSLPLLMAPSGGFPSRPTFQTVAIRSSTNPQLSITGASATATNLAGIRFNNSAGTRVGYAGDLSSGDSDFYVGTDLASASVRIDPGAGGSVVISGGTVRTGAFQRVAYGRINGTGTCALFSTANAGIASCVRNSAGSYTITWNAGFTLAPACTVSPQLNVYTASMSQTTTTTGSVGTFDAAGALADTDYFITCFGS